MLIMNYWKKYPLKEMRKLILNNLKKYYWDKNNQYEYNHIIIIILTTYLFLIVNIFTLYCFNDLIKSNIKNLLLYNFLDITTLFL